MRTQAIAANAPGPRRQPFLAQSKRCTGQALDVALRRRPPDICIWRLIGGDEQREMDAFDAVVVGAGHNGLAAAIHLLNRGWSVAVVEQAAEPGGAVKTREVTLPGYRHDLFAMN